MRKILLAIWVVIVFIASAVFGSLVDAGIEFITDGNLDFAFTTKGIVIAIGISVPVLVISYLIWQWYERKMFGKKFAVFGKRKRIKRYIFGENGLFEHRYYLDWEVHKEIAELLRDDRNVLVLGRPFGGKTRAAFEAMLLMKGWYIAFVGQDGLPTSDIEKPLSVRNMILLVDDINKYEPEKLNFDGILREFNHKKLRIIATCREGEYQKASDKGQFGDILGRFEPYKLRDATSDEGEKIAEGVGKEELGEFDGTAGSAAEDVGEMRKIYCDMPPEKVDILHTLRVFFEAGTFEVARSYLRDLYGNVYGYETDGTSFVDRIRELEGDGFVRETEGGYRARHDIYFEDDFQERFSDENLSSYIAVLERLAIEEWQDADILSSLGYLYYLRARYEGATAMYASALEIREEKLGRDHPDVATTLNNLAGLYRAQGRYDEAEPLYKRSLDITEKTLEPEHPSVAAVLNNLAGLYKAQGRYDEAEPLYERSLEMTEKAFGPDHPEVAITLDNLAGLYEAQGRYEKAGELSKRSLGLLEELFGPDHLSVATTLNNLAEHYRVQGRYDEAEPLYKRSLEISNKTLGPNHPNTAATLNNLGLLFKETDRKKEAVEYLERALKILTDVLPSNHPKIIATFESLAVIYYEIGEKEKAVEYYMAAEALKQAREEGEEEPPE